MAEIVLTTLNARYAHAAFGLRYLHANLGELRDRAEIVEFDVSQRSVDVLETLLARDPRIIGLGIYIWNVEKSTQLVGELKRVRPDIQVIVGGPEVSYETESQEIVHLADYVITGEADLAFPRLCADILRSRSEIQYPKSEITSRVIAAPLPQFADLHLPYALYTSDDIAHR